jgi:tripartite-type tricarboxylate transporter receptor subunit TctC
MLYIFSSTCIRVAAIVNLMLAMLFATEASAQSFPNKPVRIVVGFAAGGPSDIISRVVGAKMGEILGQQFVVENRPGAGGVLATEVVGRADPDGYTILNTPIANAVNETLAKNLRYKVGDGMIVVAPLAESANVIVVHPSLGVKNVAELIALAKSKPGGTFYASAGRGSATHLASELFNTMAGTKIIPVHYKGGGDALRDLLSGELKIMISSIAPVLEAVRSGHLLGVATTGLKRDPTLPDLPTVDESGLKGFEVTLWQGFTAPAGVPRPIIERLAQAAAQALQTPEIKEMLAKQGFVPMVGGPNEFDAFYRAEVSKWAKVIDASGMTSQ